MSDEVSGDQLGTGEAQSFNSERAAKDQQWTAKRADIDQIIDGTGTGIDEGVKDTIVALNLLDINTVGSCEGHIDQGLGAPTISIGSPKTVEAEELESEMQRLLDKTLQAEKDPALKDEYLSSYDQYEKKRGERKNLTAEEGKKVMMHMGEFYKGREVPLDRRLILIDLNGYHMNLQSQGADFQMSLTEEERQQKLTEYQGEMREFTEFLKGKFFEKSNVNQPTPDSTPTPATAETQ